MQHEKLYNFHKITYFLVALFVLKINQILSDQISTMEKYNIFWYTTNSFFYLIILSPDMLYQKKNKIHQKMQREKLYNLPNKAYCNCFEK
jgi:hypothetical protein